MTGELGFGVESIVTEGRLTKDSDGYYSLMLGGIGVYSGNGLYYRSGDEPISLFNTDSYLNKRLAIPGGIISEYDHPSINDIVGTNAKDIEAKYSERFVRIDPYNGVGHFKEVTLRKTNRSEPGKKEYIYEILGKFKPDGEKGAEVEAYLNDPKINTAWSMRNIRNCGIVGREKQCDLKMVITFDFVPIDKLPGIAFATKRNSIGLESLGDESFMEVGSESIINAVKDLKDVELKKQILKTINSCEGNNCILNW